MPHNPLARGLPRFTEREWLRLVLLAWLVRQGRVTEFPKVRAK